MTVQHRTDLIPAPPLQTRVYPFLVTAGLLVVLSALFVAAALATTAADAFENAKAARDAATAGSGLLADQGDLASFPLWVQPFKFVGLGLLITGIFTVFWGVLRSLQQARGAAMVESVPQLLGQRSSGRTKEDE